MVQIQMFILHKNFTKWAAGCTKTFGEGGEESRFKKATRTVVTVTGQEQSRGKVGHRPGPVPYCMRSQAHSLPVNEEEEGSWVGARFRLEKSRDGGRREAPLPGWLLNTASKTPDTHVAYQRGTARAGRNCRPEVTLTSWSTREQGPLSQTCNTQWLEDPTKACWGEWPGLKASPAQKPG